MIKVAILGYGTVGSGVVEVLTTNVGIIAKRAGQEVGVKYVLDLRDFPGDPVQEVITHDFEEIVNDEEVQIVVEVMGGIEPAYTFVKRSLLAGKSVATSNKALVAKHGAELLSIAKEKNIKTVVGNVLSSDCFYNANKNANNAWKDMGVLCVEMEAAGLYMNAAKLGKKALAILTISDHLYTGEELTAEERQNTFNDMMEIALEMAE